MDKLKEAAMKLKSMLRPEAVEDGKIVQKGLMLYKQGLVHHLKFVGESVWATVQDVTPVRVFVSLTNPENSTCTCPGAGFCRHRMATFFHAYAQVANVDEWVEDWRQPLKEGQQAEEWGLNKAKELLKQEQEPMTNEQSGYKYWAANFTNSFHEILLGQGKPTPYVVSRLLQLYLRSIRAAAPLQQEWKTLYILIGEFYGFKLLAKLSEELEHSSKTVDRYYRYIFDTLVEDIEDLSASLSVHSVPFDFDPYIEGLREETTELVATEDLFAFERVGMYRVLWSHLLKSPSWRDRERQRLESFGSGKRTVPEEVALAHQYFLARKDKEALEQVKTLGGQALTYLFAWMAELSFQGDMNRSGVYVEFVSQHLRPTLIQMNDHQAARDFTRLVMRTTAPYFRESGHEDQYEKLLAQALPYSFIEYEDFLFAKGRYAKWSELYTYANFDSFTVPNDKIKIVQKENPVVLLPILHQAVDGLIEQKNRSSYKQAVRLLKKLRTIYKKLKRVPEWETFIHKLLQRNKRLRAFQEECVRAKISL